MAIKEIIDGKIPHCNVLGCNEECLQATPNKCWPYCDYHQNGGMFGSGESYERYQIIESDFIEFIKVVPLHEDHFSVYSPILRDIILRACVEIEIFFKEWARYECEDINCSLFNPNKSATKLMKEWKIKDYYYFTNKFHNYMDIYVRPLEGNIQPFESWTADSPPAWWTKYNRIKHDGHTNRKEADLKTATFALAALFHLHCTNKYSCQYLKEFKPEYVRLVSFERVELYSENITTPLDSKNFLFKANSTGRGKVADLVTKKQLDSKFGKKRL